MGDQAPRGEPASADSVRLPNYICRHLLGSGLPLAELRIIATASAQQEWCAQTWFGIPLGSEAADYVIEYLPPEVDYEEYSKTYKASMTKDEWYKHKNMWAGISLA